MTAQKPAVIPSIHRPLLIFLVIVTALVWSLIFIPYATRAAPLSDDYWALDFVSRASLESLLTAPQAGFYRPLVLLFLKLEFAFAAWDHPWLYALMSSLLHTIVSALVGYLAAKSFKSAVTGAVAAGIWLCLPMNNESLFWFSAQNDLLAAAFALAAVAVVAFKESKPALAAALMLTSLLAKETWILALPLALTLYLAAKDPLRPWALPRSVIKGLAGLCLGVALFLALRLSFAGTSTQYGDPFVIFRQANIPHNLWEYGRFLVKMTIPGASPFEERLSKAGSAAFLLAICLGLFATRRKGLFLLFLLSTLALLLPVAWGAATPGNLGGGRLTYAATIPVTILAAEGIASVARIRGRRAFFFLAQGLACLIALGIVGTSLYALRAAGERWAEAAHVARQAFYQVERHAGKSKIFLRNMPWNMPGAPYILTCSAFRAAWPKQLGPAPSFRCHAVNVVVRNQEIMETLPGEPLGDGGHDVASADEFPLDLAILSTAQCSSTDPSECFTQARTATYELTPWTSAETNGEVLWTHDLKEQQDLSGLGWHKLDGSKLTSYRFNDDQGSRVGIVRCFHPDSSRHSLAVDSCPTGFIDERMGFFGQVPEPAGASRVAICTRGFVVLAAGVAACPDEAKPLAEVVAKASAL